MEYSEITNEFNNYHTLLIIISGLIIIYLIWVNRSKKIIDYDKTLGITEVMVFKSNCLSVSLSLTLAFASLTWSIMSLTRVTFILQALILLLCQSTQVESLFLVDSTVPENHRPIIGILTQEISYNLNRAYPDQFDSYIAASYVKYVESAGARVVPIWVGEPDSYYEDILEKINGVLFPGGSTCFNQTGGYADAGRVIYRIAKEMNDQGDYFPIWGTCLGFELLTFLEANGAEHRSNCKSSNEVLPLKFKPAFRRSRMFENAKKDIIKILDTENVTANFHQYCVTEKDLARVNLTEIFRVMSTNNDTTGLEFISSLEHVNYPFYGIQFHPEKNNFEWISRLSLPHTANSIRISNYFADFFVNEARKNLHKFESLEEESKNLIYKFTPTYTGMQDKAAFEQCYLFKNKRTIN